MSFVTENIVNRLSLTRTRASVSLIGGSYAGKTRGTIELHLRSVYNPYSFCTIVAHILPRLTTKLSVKCRSWPHIKGLQLADPDFACSQPIDLIIGSDYYGTIIREGLIKGDQDQSVAQETLFGWILSGTVSSEKIPNSAYKFYYAVDNELQDMLTKFWKQEELPSSTTTILKPDEVDCERHFLTTHSRDSSGRYVVHLPFVSDPNKPESRRLLLCETYGDYRSDFYPTKCINNVIRILFTSF